MTGEVKRLGESWRWKENNTQGILSEILSACVQEGVVLKHNERTGLHAECHKWCKEIHWSDVDYN